MSTRRRAVVSLAATAVVATTVSLVAGTGPVSAFPAPPGCPTTGSVANTIPTPVGPPTATSFTTESHPHQVGYSAIGADGKLYATFNNTYFGYQTGELFCLGGQATDTPGIVAYDSESRSVAAFVRASTGRLYQRYITGGAYTSVGSYTVVNGASSTNGPAALLFDGVFHLFVRGTNGALYHGFRQNDSLSSWRFEQVGGAIVGSPVAVVDGSRMLVAMVGTNGSVYTVTGTNFAWGPFVKIVSQVEGSVPTQILTRTPPSLVRNMRSGEITMYAVSSTYGLFSITKPGTGSFANRLWVRIDSVLPPDARISAAANVHNDTVVYARFLDRSSGQYLTAYTQRTLAAPEWNDYVITPYTCANCAPDPNPCLDCGFGTGGAGVAARTVPRTRVLHDPTRTR